MRSTVTGPRNKCSLEGVHRFILETVLVTLTLMRPEKRIPEMKAEKYMMAKIQLGVPDIKRSYRTATLLMEESPPER